VNDRGTSRREIATRRRGPHAPCPLALQFPRHRPREPPHQAEAEKLVAAAHKVCPYSNATRGNIDVGLEISVV
jgi:organic hydroperoxide reductase OsmC/OhrA